MEGLQDMRVLQLLEELTDRDTVIALIEDGLDTPVTFKQYPRAVSYTHLVRIAAAAPIPVTSSTEKLWGQENAAAPNAARNHRKGHNTPHISFKPRIYAIPLT